MARGAEMGTRTRTVWELGKGEGNHSWYCKGNGVPRWMQTRAVPGGLGAQD